MNQTKKRTYYENISYWSIDCPLGHNIEIYRGQQIEDKDNLACGKCPDLLVCRNGEPKVFNRKHWDDSTEKNLTIMLLLDEEELD